MPGRCFSNINLLTSFSGSPPTLLPCNFLSCSFSCFFPWHGASSNWPSSWSPKLPIFNKGGQTTKERPRAESGLRVGGQSLGPALQHKSLGKLLASPAVRRQITRGINVIFFPRAEFIRVYGKINVDLRGERGQVHSPERWE